MNAVFHTLRFRLAFWYGLILSVILTASGGLTYGVVRYRLMHHHDGELQEAAASVTKVLSQHEDCEHLTDSQKAALDQIGHLVLFHEMEGERRVFYRSPDFARSPAIEGSTTRPAVLPASGWFETMEGKSGPLRKYSTPYHSRAGRPGLIHVIHGMGDIEDPLASLRRALLLMAPLAVLVSAASGFWLARRALAPVDEVTRTARQIEASQLSRRLPPPEAQDEIGRLVDTFNQMIARLEASFDAMKRFTADASHELRSPLATMRGAIDVALSRPREASEYQQALASVGDDVDRLRAIVEDLLVLARADAGRIALERSSVRLDVVTAEVVESFQPLAAEKGVQLSSDCTATVVVLGDERWLRQLLFNLLENAIKFSGSRPSHSPPSVSARVTSENSIARLVVADSGPGIPEKDLPHIFERFFRGDPSRAYADGFGLGLAIATWITEAQGGRIDARNRSEGGCVFSVTLPLAADEVPVARAVP